MGNAQELYSCQKNFNHASTKVVSNKEVWIDDVKFVDEHLKHLFLIIIHSGCLAFNLLVDVKGQGKLVQLAHKSKRLELFIVGGSVLLNFVLNNAADQCDFIGVMLAAGSLNAYSQRDQWR